MSGGRSSSSNATTSKSYAIDQKQAADGEAIVTRAGGDVIVNQTLGDALPIAERAFDIADFAVAANGTAFEEAISFASRVVSSNEDLSRDSIAYVADANEQALGVIAAGFDQALQESREDTTQLLSQAITFGVPALVIYLLWSR